jgi:hypothetical protein
MGTSLAMFDPRRAAIVKSWSAEHHYVFPSNIYCQFILVSRILPYDAKLKLFFVWGKIKV